MKTKKVKLSTLKPHPKNPNAHPENQINDDKIKDLEKQSRESERKILIVAKIKAQNSVNGDPSALNLTALEKATKMLLDYDARMAPQAEPSFANRKEALEWLQRQGYKVKKSKFYADCKKGLLKLQDDGSVFESDLKKYTRKAALNRLSDTPEPDQGDLQTKKIQAELDKTRAQVKILEHELAQKRGETYSRLEFDLNFAGRVAILKSGIEHMIYSYSFEWSELILNGDKTSAAQRLIDGITKVVKKQFNDFANIKNFEVVFAKEDLTEETTEEK